jgi:hypothetical protein
MQVYPGGAGARELGDFFGPVERMTGIRPLRLRPPAAVLPLPRYVHFYHAWCDGPWQDIVAEHLAMLRGAKFHGPVYLSLTGRRENREAVHDEFLRSWDGPLQVATGNGQGYEQECLDALRSHAVVHPDDTILYAHTKGITHGSDPASERIHQAEWRRCMTRAVLLGWREKIQLLDMCDAIGPHLLTPEDYPGLVSTPFFGGNFWWANASFIASCQPCSRDSRHDAEAWLGMNGARMMSLGPKSWPHHPHA